MHALSASELLAAWERGKDARSVQRALLLLAAACPDQPAEALADLSIGQRDARLLALREWTFGPRLTSLASCPRCGERLELSFDVADICVAATPPPPEGLAVAAGGYDLRARLPNSHDLLALADIGDATLLRQTLLRRCVLVARHAGAECPVELLPPEIETVIAERLAQADPQADIQLDLNCPACEHAWRPVFDIVSFFWSEIEVWAYRILREVHLLAAAYGWREADILALSPLRRQIYLEMLGR